MPQSMVLLRQFCAAEQRNKLKMESPSFHQLHELLQVLRGVLLFFIRTW
jgi:hypothetical protein